MDWSKAKTILIIAFLITNIILFLVLYTNSKDIDPLLSEEFIQYVEEMLMEKKIGLGSEIPLDDVSLIPLIVEYEKISKDDMNDLFFNGEGSLREDESSVTITGDAREVKIINNKRIIYENLSDKPIYDHINENKARDLAEEFIVEKDLARDSMELSFIDGGDDRYNLIYSKKYLDVYLENSFLSLEIDRSGIRRMERVWLNVLDEGDIEISTSKAPKAILSLLSMDDAYGRTIEDISICHYFDPEEHEYIKTSKSAKKGKTIPAWRILFDDGYRIIIDNY